MKKRCECPGEDQRGAEKEIRCTTATRFARRGGVGLSQLLATPHLRLADAKAPEQLVRDALALAAALVPRPMGVGGARALATLAVAVGLLVAEQLLVLPAARELQVAARRAEDGANGLVKVRSEGLLDAATSGFSNIP